MPPVTKLGRLARIVTLPETRGLIVAAARSETLRDIARRAVVEESRHLLIGSFDIFMTRIAQGRTRP